MAFQPTSYVTYKRFGLYDGTNSADILAFDWSDPVTIVSERNGVLVLSNGSDPCTIPEGFYVGIGSANELSGSYSAEELAMRYAPLPGA